MMLTIASNSQCVARHLHFWVPEPISQAFAANTSATIPLQRNCGDLTYFISYVSRLVRTPMPSTSTRRRRPGQ